MTFGRKTYTPAPRAPIRPATRRATYTAQPAAAPVEKEGALQHQGYMDVVRTMACARCGRAGPSQFCHADEGKGTGLKTDCRRGFPGCPDCHYLIGSTGKLGKQARRELETEYGARTRAQVLAAGRWPTNLPMMEPTP